MIVRVPFDFRGVRGRCEIVGDQFAKGCVVGVFVWLEEFDDWVGLGQDWFAGSGAVGKTLFGIGDFSAGADLVVVMVSVTVGKQVVLLGFQVLGQIVEQGRDGLVERKVVDDGKNAADDHQDHGAQGAFILGSSNGKETNHANDQEIATNGGVLQGARIHHALSIDVRVRHIEHVVSIREIEEIQAESGKTKHQRGDRSICDG